MLQVLEIPVKDMEEKFKKNLGNLTPRAR